MVPGSRPLARGAGSLTFELSSCGSGSRSMRSHSAPSLRRRRRSTLRAHSRSKLAAAIGPTTAGGAAFDPGSRTSSLISRLVVAEKSIREFPGRRGLPRRLGLPGPCLAPRRSHSISSWTATHYVARAEILSSPTCPDSQNAIGIHAQLRHVGGNVSRTGP